MSAVVDNVKELRIPKEMLDQLAGQFSQMIAEKVDEKFRTANEAHAETQKAFFAGMTQAREADRPADRSLFVGRLIRMLATAKGDPDRASREAVKIFGEKESAEVVKALAAGVSSAGGFIIPPEYSADLIALLVGKTAVRRMGAISMPMNGTLSIPKLTSGGTATYVGESQNIPPSQQTFGMLNLTAKTLAALVPISNSLLRWSNPSADSVVRNDLVTQMSLREDLAFLRGDGTSNTPRGIRNYVAAANVFATTGVTLAQITTDLGAAVLRLENANVPMTTPGWMFSPRSWNTLMTIRDTNGNYAWRDEMLRGNLWGFPFTYTTQVPSNLGGGSNESEVYLVDFAQTIIGESTDLVIDASSDAAYHDGSAVVAAFSRDETVIRCIAQHDFGMRYDLAGAIITGVLW